MLRKFSIKAKLISMIFLMALIILGLAGMGAYSIRQGSSSLAEVYENNVQPLILLQEMDSVLKEIRFRMVAVPLEQMSIQGSRDHLTEARERIPKIWAEFNTTMKGAQLEEQDKKVIESIDKEVASLSTFLRKLDGIYEKNNKEALLAPLQEEWPLINRQLLKPLAQLIPAQDAAVKKIYESSVALGKKQIAFSLMVMSVSIVVLLVFAFGLMRSIFRPMRVAVNLANQLAEGDLTAKIEVNSNDEIGMLLASMQNMVTKLSQVITDVRGAADNLSGASEEVSATAQSMSQAASEQAASVEETSASVEQMSASITQNTENAKVTDGMAVQAANQATEGGQAVEQMVEAMKQIAKRIGIIDDIAYQTNLLALNAAIEAARAGEHGRGFAVVAGEVRKLAERSQVAAQEIGEMAVGSVAVAEKAGKLLGEMVPSIRKTSDLVQEIAAASEEQSSSVGQVNTAMVQLNQITQQNASSSEELAATAEEMSGQAENLQQLVAFFKIGRAAPGAASAEEAKTAKSEAKLSLSAVDKTVDSKEFVKF